MYAKLSSGICVSAALLLAGCGVQGKWDLSSVSPTAAQRDVEYHTLWLDKDGSFYAEAKEEGGKIRTESGTYTYSDGILHLKAHDGEAHTYDAELKKSGQEMELEDTWEGRRLTLVYARKPEQ